MSDREKSIIDQQELNLNVIQRLAVLEANGNSRWRIQILWMTLLTFSGFAAPYIPHVFGMLGGVLGV
jgi:hypothetical protein